MILKPFSQVYYFMNQRKNIGPTHDNYYTCKIEQPNERLQIMQGDFLTMRHFSFEMLWIAMLYLAVNEAQWQLI